MAALRSRRENAQPMSTGGAQCQHQEACLLANGPAEPAQREHRGKPIALRSFLHPRPHAAQSAAASLAIAAGADIKVVQTMLGHKDAAMTLNTYTGLFPDRLDVVANALDHARRTAVESENVDR